jgi:hypothetical protein
MRTRKAFLLPVLAAALALGACDDAGTVSPGDDSAQLSILLTDAPGDFEAAVVTISEIYLQGEGDDGRIVLRSEPVTTDLLTLANDAAELVSDAVVPAGTYSQLRFVITGGYIEVENEDGSTRIYATQGYDQVPADRSVDGTLKCPSCEQTGIKVNLPGGAVSVDGEQKVLLIDFDVSQTFGQQAGASGMWVMRPALKATEFQTSGSVSATLALADTVTLPVVDSIQVALGAFSATLTPAAGGDAKQVQLTDSDGDGVFEAKFVYLFPGDYALGFAAPEGVTFTTNPTLPHTVTLDSGATVSADFTVTSAAAAQ